MPILSTTRTYSNGNTLSASDLDSLANSIETFVNTTKLDSANLQSGAVINANLAGSSVSASNIQTGAVAFAALDSSVTGFLCPTGAVTAYVGTSAPSGWLMCDGSAVSRSTYAALYLVVGASHGSGDGSTTFDLPDYRGRFLRGQNHSTGRDPNASSRTASASGGNTGDAVGSVQIAATALPTTAWTTSDPGSHTHTIPQQAGAQSGSGAGGGLGIGSTVDSGSAGSHTHTISGGDSETRPININVNWIVKT